MYTLEMFLWMTRIDIKATLVTVEILTDFNRTLQMLTLQVFF